MSRNGDLRGSFMPGLGFRTPATLPRRSGGGARAGGRAWSRSVLDLLLDVRPPLLDVDVVPDLQRAAVHFAGALAHHRVELLLALVEDPAHVVAEAERLRR